MRDSTDHTPSPEDIQRQVDRILASNAFQKAGRSSAFLSYIVNKTLAGEAERIKEYAIGVEVFGRDTTYDPALDSIVRVEATRLRARLVAYYEDEGRSDDVLIELPKGSYSPEVFCRNLPPEQDTIAKPFINQPPLADSPLRRWALSAAVVLAIGSPFLMSLWSEDPGKDQQQTMRIVVLPFHVYSESPDQSAIARRLTDSVTAALVQAGTLSVVPSTSARAYQNADRSLQDIAGELKVDLILEARLLSSDKPIRVETFMTDAHRHQKFWVDSSFAGDDVESVASQVVRATLLTISQSSSPNQATK